MLKARPEPRLLATVTAAVAARGGSFVNTPGSPMMPSLGGSLPADPTLRRILAAEAKKAAGAVQRQALWQAAVHAVMVAQAAEREAAAAEGGDATAAAAVGRAADVQALRCGRLPREALERLAHPPSICVFVSSTFMDTAAERNFWQLYTLPSLVAKCAALGLGFEAVDLRWGVTNATTDDHGTIDLCLSEVQRCLDASASLAFVFFSGERYGWRALPPTVAADELETLLPIVARDSPESLAAVTTWYRRDDNAVPPAYRLRAVMEGRDDPDVPPEVADFWAVEGAIAAALRGAAWKAQLSRAQLDEWNDSVTHKEVRLALTTAPHRAMVLHRTLVGLESAAAKNPADAAAAEHCASGDDAERLRYLRVEAIRRVPRHRTMRYTPTWKGRPLDADDADDLPYFRAISADFFAAVAADAEAVAAAHAPLAEMDTEAATHCLLASRRAAAFCGRGELAAAVVASMVPRPVRTPVKVVYGTSGAGKTSLLAAAVVDRSGLPEGAMTVARFCGTSPGSSSVRRLLRSLCEQIGRAYGRIVQEMPESVTDLGLLLRSLMAECATSDRPLRIAIDALDQLVSVSVRGQMWTWLPQHLPPYVALVVSTLPDERQGLLASLQAAGRLRSSPDNIEVGPISSTEARAILASLLAMPAGRRGPRTVTEAQREMLDGAVAAAGGKRGVSALHLKLLAGEAVRWRSWDVSPPPLPGSVEGLIEGLFARTEHRHGAPLIRHVLGLLACRRDGFSQDALLDMLSASDDVLGYKGKKDSVLEFSEPPVRRCPPLVFARLRDALKEFVKERGGPGGMPVLAFYHRQFLETAERRYLAHPADRARLLGLATDLFSGRLARTFPQRGISPHKRPVAFSLPAGPQSRPCPSLEAQANLPVILLALGELGGVSARPRELAETLCGLDFVAAVAGASKLGDLKLLLIEAKEQIGRSLEAAKATGAAVGDCETYVEALNAPPGCAPQRKVRGLMESEGLNLTGCWEQLNKPASFPACVATLEPGNGACVAFSADSLLVATGSADDAVLLWSAATAEQLRSLDGLAGHKGKVFCVAFSRTGEHLASGGVDTTVKLWATSTGEALRSCEGHLRLVTSVAFSADEATLASGSEDKTARLWQCSTGECLLTLTGHGGSVSSVAFSPSAALVATGSSDKTVRLHSTITGDLVRSLVPAGMSGAVSSVAFAPDGATLASGSWDCLVRLWGVDSGELLRPLKAHTGRVTSVDFSRDGRFLASGSHDKTVRLWAAASGVLLRTIEGHFSEINAVAFSPDGAAVASAAQDRHVRLWAASQQLGSQRGHNYDVTCMTLSTDGGKLLCGYSDGFVRLLSASTGDLVRTLGSEFGRVAIVLFSPSGEVCAAASWGLVQLWSTATGDILRTLSVPSDDASTGERHVTGFAFSADSKTAAMATGDNNVRLWDVATGDLVRLLLPAPGTTGGASRLAFTGDSRALACALGETVRLVSAETGKVTLTLSGHRGAVLCLAVAGEVMATGSGDKTGRVWFLTARVATPGSYAVAYATFLHSDAVTCVCFAPGGRLLASGSDDRTVRVWRVNAVTQGLELLRTFEGFKEGVTGAVFLHRAKNVAACSGDVTVRQWSIDSGLRLPDGHTDVGHDAKGHSGDVACVATSPDGAKLATGAADSIARIWAAGTGELLRSLSGHGGPVEAAAFSPTGAVLATAGRDRTARLWAVESGAALRTLYESESPVVGGSRLTPVSPTVGRLGGRALAWSAENQVALSYSGLVAVWSAATGVLQRSVDRDLDMAASGGPGIDWAALLGPAWATTAPSLTESLAGVPVWSETERWVATSGNGPSPSTLSFPAGLSPLFASVLLSTEGGSGRLFVVFREGPVHRFWAAGIAWGGGEGEAASVDRRPSRSIA